MSRGLEAYFRLKTGYFRSLSLFWRGVNPIWFVESKGFVIRSFEIYQNKSSKPKLIIANLNIHFLMLWNFGLLIPIQISFCLLQPSKPPEWCHRSLAEATWKLPKLGSQGKIWGDFPQKPGICYDMFIYTLRTQTLEICRVWLETSGMFDEMKIPRVSYANLGFSFSNPYWTRI